MVSFGSPKKLLIIESIGISFITETLSIFGYKSFKLLKISFFFSGEIYLGDSSTEMIPIALAPNSAT